MIIFRWGEIINKGIFSVFSYSDFRLHYGLRGEAFLLRIPFIFLILLLIAGCGHENILLKSDSKFVSQNDSHSGSGFYISDVIDERNVSPELIGNIEGNISGNKCSIKMNEDIASYIKRYSNNLLNIMQKENPSRALRIEITKFILTENYTRKDSYYLFGTFIFTYLNPNCNEVSSIIDISENISKDKYQLLSNINDALKNCLQKFLKTVSSKNFPDSTRYNNILTIDQTSGEMASDNQTQIIYKETSGISVEEITQKALGIGLEYYSGSKIKSGYQINMKFAWQKKGWEFGHDIGFMYLSINNEPYTGYLYSFCFPAYIKYNLGSENVIPYIGGSIQLLSGTEKYKDHSNLVKFFFGPTSEEYLGLSVNRNFFIEAGLFELFLINSKILPDDFGFRLSCHFLFAN